MLHNRDFELDLVVLKVFVCVCFCRLVLQLGRERRVRWGEMTKGEWRRGGKWEVGSVEKK